LNNASTVCLPCPSGTFALGTGFAQCESIGLPVIEFINITAHETTVVIQTNFTALFPLNYSCSAFCQIYINNELILTHTLAIISKYVLLPLRLGTDTLLIVYNGTFKSSLTSALTCDVINGFNYCRSIPKNNVIQVAVLITQRNPLSVNMYADYLALKQVFTTSR
jgi:hypothetical protein